MNNSKHFDFSICHWARAHEKFSHDYLLINKNWDDFGYYTLYEMMKVLRDNEIFNILIAKLCFMKVGQQSGEKVSFSEADVAFIDDIESAERMFLFMTKAERDEMIKTFKISFDPEPFQNEPVFIKSVMRVCNCYTEYEAMQKEIKAILDGKRDVCDMIKRHREMVDGYISTAKHSDYDK